MTTWHPKAKVPLLSEATRKKRLSKNRWGTEAQSRRDSGMLIALALTRMVNQTSGATRAHTHTHMPTMLCARSSRALVIWEDSQHLPCPTWIEA